MEKVATCAAAAMSYRFRAPLKKSLTLEAERQSTHHFPHAEANAAEGERAAGECRGRGEGQKVASLLPVTRLR